MPPFGCRRQTQINQTNPDNHTPTFQLVLHRAKDVSALTLLCRRGAVGHGQRAEPGPQSAPCHGSVLSNKSGEHRGAASAQGLHHSADGDLFSFLIASSLFFPTALTSGFSHFHYCDSPRTARGATRGAAARRSSPCGHGDPGGRSAGPEGFAAAFLSRQWNRRKRFPVPKGCAGSGMLCARPPHPYLSVPAARNAASR